MISMLHHVEDRHAALAQARRILMLGGRLVLMGFTDMERRIAGGAGGRSSAAARGRRARSDQLLRALAPRPPRRVARGLGPIAARHRRRPRPKPAGTATVLAWTKSR
jgi:hypothetical protein